MSPRRHVVGWAIALAVGAPIAIFACGPSAHNFIDATDTPAGGLVVDPGNVTCGANAEDGGLETCDVTQANVCCAGPGVDGGAICASLGKECPDASGLFTCNESADCNLHNVCCAPLPGIGGYLGAQCATSCPSPELQLCRTNGECPGGACVIQKCPDGQIYEMCGLSSAASFRCKAVPPS